jgi:hypothetical protein
MRPSQCLSEQDLTLLHYGENPSALPVEAAQRHLAACADCRHRQTRLARDLDRLPAFDPDLAPHNATRLAARVVERLPRRRSLLPAMAGAISAASIVFAVSIWTPGPPVMQNPAGTPQLTTGQTPAAETDQNLSALPQVSTEQAPSPDLDLLENLELLRELDTLSDLAGV